MAKLYISEYKDIAYTYVSGSNEPLMIASETVAPKDSVVDFGSGEAKSAAFAPGTAFIRVWSDADVCIRIGIAPTATTSNKPLSAKTPEYFAVTPGHKLSAIALG